MLNESFGHLVGILGVRMCTFSVMHEVPDFKLRQFVPYASKSCTPARYKLVCREYAVEDFS